MATWFAFHGMNNNQAIKLAGIQEKEASGAGFHGYATQNQAQANENSVNFFQRGLADALIADYHTAVKQQAQPGGTNANVLNPATAIKAGTTGLGIKNPLDFITSQAFWIRAGEVLLGIVLIAAGAAKLAETNGAAKALVNNTPLGHIAKVIK